MSYPCDGSCPRHCYRPQGESESQLWTSTVTVTWKPRQDLVTFVGLPGQELDTHDTVASGGWWAKLNWSCGRFGEIGYIDGAIRTRYPAALKIALDQVMAMAERLGVKPHGEGLALFVSGDGEDPEVMLPDGWRKKIMAEAKRRGWDSYEEAGT